MAACRVAHLRPEWQIVVLEGTSRPATKLLITGGGRCNVTNRVVTPEDYTGSGRSAIRKVIAAFTAEQTRAFFEEIGVLLREEAGGKLFPRTGGAHAVRNALLNRARSLAVVIRTACRVSAVQRVEQAFVLDCPKGSLTARRILLATGGLSYPKTGSDGSGLRLAESLGHTVTPPTPALVPLVLEGDFHRGLSGITLEVELTIRAAGARPARTRGPLLWTHFGISGPAVLDASGFWHKARLENRSPQVFANVLPGEDFIPAERRLLDLATRRPRSHLRNALATWLPGRFCDAVLACLHIAPTTPLAHLSREHRRRLIEALTAWPLPVRDSLGYDHAEITAGGVPLNEVNPATLESRRCPGLFLAGEMLDVAGRVGGFNLQWAWSSGWVAAEGMSTDNIVAAGR